jgi:hypothetical protein
MAKDSPFVVSFRFSRLNKYSQNPFYHLNDFEWSFCKERKSDNLRPKPINEKISPAIFRKKLFLWLAKALVNRPSEASRVLFKGFCYRYVGAVLKASE